MATLDDVTLALAYLQARQDRYREYREALEGKRPARLFTGAYRAAFGKFLDRFAYNRCSPVVDAYADRLQVVGFGVPGAQGGGAKPTIDRMEAIWHRNRMPRRQGEVHVESLTTGDAYLFVWPDEESRAVLTPNRAHLCAVLWDDERPGEVALAVKTWRITRGDLAGRWRVTVYGTDVVQRFVTGSAADAPPTTGTGLIPFEDDSPPEIGNPYGRVPVFPFPNNAFTGEYGVSELRDVLPLQDGINKDIVDQLVASEYLAFPQRWVTGIEPQIDPESGREIWPFAPGADRVWSLPEGATPGEFAAANIAMFATTQDAWDAKISRATGVPVHWLAMTGGFPSGESLKTAEAPFVARVKDRQRGFGDVWAEAMQFALLVEGETPPERVEVEWQAAESRSEQDFWTVAQLKIAAGVPPEQVWREAGYGADEMARFATAATERQQAAAEAFGVAFDRGEAA